MSEKYCLAARLVGRTCPVSSRCEALGEFDKEKIAPGLTELRGRAGFTASLPPGTSYLGGRNLDHFGDWSTGSLERIQDPVLMQAIAEYLRLLSENGLWQGAEDQRLYAAIDACLIAQESDRRVQ